MRKIFLCVILLLSLVLSACHSVPTQHRPSITNVSMRDATVIAPNAQFLETPQSKSVIVGSHVYASVNACQLIKRYRVRTNADFTGSLNLLKYRSALMGAKWITIVGHTELDRLENAYFADADQIIIRDGVDAGSARYLTTLIADLYDCPCNVNTCSGR